MISSLSNETISERDFLLPIQCPVYKMAKLKTSQFVDRIPIWIFLCYLGFATVAIQGASVSTQIEQGLRLNELLASNQSGIQDEEGNASDWIELANTSSRPIELAGYRLTDNLDDLEKWTFPKHRISPGGHLIVWMSGRPTNPLAPTDLQPTVRTAPIETTLIDSEVQWKYRSLQPSDDESTTAEIPRDWTQIDYIDSHFLDGRAGFGYGDNDDVTVLSEGTTIVLLRHQFVLKSLPATESLVLQIDYDDGFVAYLNGKKVASRNAPDGRLNQHSLATASHDAGTPERINLSVHSTQLRIGKNVLAIAGLNINRLSSDLSLHPVLGTLSPAYHAHFRLKKKGGSVYLVTPDGKVTDEVRYSKQEADQSIGWTDSEPPTWGHFLTPTPGIANFTKQRPASIHSRLSFLPNPGAFQNPINLQIQDHSSASLEIRYTTDGTEPTESSPRFLGPIPLDDSTLIRAASFVEKERASPIISGTYLVGQDTKLPVLAINMDSADFRDVQLQTRATGRTSERPATLEYFDPLGKRTKVTGFGLRLHGGAGRNGGFNTKKSYRTYFRKTYGDGRLGGWIIPEAKVKNFDQLVLRASSNDRAFHGSSIRDQVIRDCHADMGALASRGSWCVLRINSQTRGVYNITERMNEDFLASHLGPGEFDIIKTGETVLSGSREGWDELRHFVRTNDFSNDANYEALSRRVDIENLTSYVIVNLCLLNFDWPHNNWYAARSAPDGKWIFLCWDAEWGLGYRHPGLGDAPYGVDVDPYAFMDSGGAYSNSLIRNIFLALINHPNYRGYYQQEVRRYLSGPLSTKNIMKHIHRHRDAISHDIAVEYRAKGQNLKRWHDQIKEVEHFARHSSANFLKHTDRYFSHRATPSRKSRPAVIETENGQLKVTYADRKGQLQELSSPTIRSGWDKKALKTPANAPLAVGSPVAFLLDGQNRHLLYRGKQGHLHELYQPGSATSDDIWKHTDLTSLLQLPSTSGDPSVVIVGNVPHVVFVDKMAHPHELWSDKIWRHHPLPITPRPAGDAVISSTPGTLHVTYKTMFGVPCEQTLSLEEASQGRRSWRHRLTQRIPCAGQPIGLYIEGKWRVAFQPAMTWPLAEPFIFHWNGAQRRGYQEYSGSRKGLIQAWDARQRFQHLELIGSPTSPAEGTPITLHDQRRNRHYIAYRDSNGHIYEANMTLLEGAKSPQKEEMWQLTNLTQLTDAPLSAEDITGLLSSITGDRHYVYLGHNGDLNQLRFNGTWSHQNLSKSASHPQKN